MRIALNPFILAEIFIAHARAVTCRASVALRRDFFKGMSREQSVACVRGAADVTLRTGGMTCRAARVKRFLHFWMIWVGARSLEIRPISRLCKVQSVGEIFNLAGMTIGANFSGIGCCITHDIFVRGSFVGGSAVAAVTSNAADFAMHRIDKRLVTDKNFFPRFQRG